MKWLLATRGRIVLFGLALLLILDIGRSIYARVGFAEPTVRWEPEPSEYANLAWPPGADLRSGATLGQTLFAKHCSVCHGPEGRGNGPAAPSLHPRPRDFTIGNFKYKTTSAESLPSDDDLIKVVRDGLAASAMPYYSDVLAENEIRAVVQHVKSLSSDANVPAVPIAVPARVEANELSIGRGRTLYTTYGCIQCHGADYRGGLKYEDEKGHFLTARDLTAPWTFRGGADPDQLWWRFTSGMAPGPMPSYESSMTPEERWDLVNFVRSLARLPPWESGGLLLGPGHDPDPVRRGDYLVHMEMCGLCHTQINHTGIYREDDAFLAGGMRVGAYPHEVVISRNLTSDEKTGIGNYSATQIAQIVRNGRRPDRVLNPWGMPWFILHAFTDHDATAIGAYLKTLPAVSHYIPPPLTFGVLETVIAKLTGPLPGGQPIFLSYSDGDFGQAGDQLDSRELTQRILIGAQYAILLLGLLAFLFAGSRRRVANRGPQSWVKSIAVAFLLLLLLVVLWAIHGLPTIVPPEQLSQAVLAGTPELKVKADTNPERAALIARGRYLFQVTSCAFCHNNDGSGGSKISWKPFGTLWTRNITSDAETGIGAWTDAQIARAIRSGMSRQGRQLHWQGMPWDLFSNMDEEDLRALVAFLRTLPPVKKQISQTRSPAADDCSIYSFFIRGELDKPGCR